MLSIPSLKRKTKKNNITTLSEPANLYLPLTTYQGTMQLLVHPGQKVLKYECIASSQGSLSTRLNAPVSGTVKEVLVIDEKQFLRLENDFMHKEVVRHRLYNPETISLQELVNILRKSGIEGAGGARFPTHIKYNIQGKDIDTLILNGVECEPYLSSDAILMQEKSNDLLQAAKTIQRVIKARKIVFVLEKQNKDIGQILKNSAKALKIDIKICFVPNTYPQGGELQIIKAVTGLELKKGAIPANHGILVNNVATLWAIYRAIFEGIPYTERVVTVSGNSSKKQGNYLVKIGTPISHLLKETGNESIEEDLTLILGGAMMGKLAHNLSTPINKGSGGVLILKKSKSTSVNCIKCGDCVTVCPQHLMPLEFVRHQDNTAMLNEYHLKNCIECGACAYICPSDVPLMESINKGKSLLSA
jgi:electron transport complex protein RnfC